MNNNFSEFFPMSSGIILRPHQIYIAAFIIYLQSTEKKQIWMELLEGNGKSVIIMLLAQYYADQELNGKVHEMCPSSCLTEHSICSYRYKDTLRTSMLPLSWPNIPKSSVSRRTLKAYVIWSLTKTKS